MDELADCLMDCIGGLNGFTMLIDDDDDDDDNDEHREIRRDKTKDREKDLDIDLENIGRRIIPTANSSVRRIRKRRIWERRIRKRRRIRGEFVTQPERVPDECAEPWALIQCPSHPSDLPIVKGSCNPQPKIKILSTE